MVHRFTAQVWGVVPLIPLLSPPIPHQAQGIAGRAYHYRCTIRQDYSLLNLPQLAKLGVGGVGVISINDSTLASVCYTVIYMVRVGVRAGINTV